MCRCCQSCLEDFYWNCIEERFCYDESIAKYNPDEDEFVTKNNLKITSNGQDNNNVSPIRIQPMRRNESSLFSNGKIHEEDYRREIQTSVPILAPEILAVFANSQIFQDNSQKLSRVNTKTYLPSVHNTGKEKQLANDQEKLIFQLEVPDTAVTNYENTNNETLLSSGSIDKKIKFTIADNNISPIELLTISHSSSQKFLIIPEKVDEEETEDESDIDLKNNKTVLNESLITELDEIILRPKIKQDDANISGGLLSRRNLIENRPLRNVQSMPHFNTVRSVSSENDIFSITGSGLYGQLSMTPEVPSISYANLPKNYEETPTIEKYKESMSLYELQAVNKEKADSLIIDYSMPRYFRKAALMAHSLENCNTDGANNSINNVSKDNMGTHIGGHLKKPEISKRLKQLRGSLPPLLIHTVHRHHQKKDETKQVD